MCICMEIWQSNKIHTVNIYAVTFTILFLIIKCANRKTEEIIEFHIKIFSNLYVIRYV